MSDLIENKAPKSMQFPIHMTVMYPSNWIPFDITESLFHVFSRENSKKKDMKLGKRKI